MTEAIKSIRSAPALDITGSEVPEALRMKHSHVRRFKLQALKLWCSVSSVSMWPPRDMAGDTIMKTTVDHALIRGLGTAGPVMRRGASSV